MTILSRATVLIAVRKIVPKAIWTKVAAKTRKFACQSHLVTKVAPYHTFSRVVDEGDMSERIASEQNPRLLFACDT